MKRLLLPGLLFALSWSAVADPQLTAWLTNYSGQYARVYTTTNNRANGNSATTWTNQSVAAYADIAQILHSANWVYVRYPDLPSHVVGPWLNPQGAVGSLWPSNQKNIAKFPRNPSIPNKKTPTGTGYSGNWVNGVAIFNSLDGKAWNGSALVNSPHTRYTNYWQQNAPVGEDYNFDYALGHQNPAGVYHTHQDPRGLRYQLGDHITYNSSTKNYSESTSTNYTHSPILGYAYDGYPIYGPYGYGTATNSASIVRRMVSGYVKRDGTSGTDTVSTNLGVIPLWYARYRTNQFFNNGETTLTTSVGTNRPSVNATYPLGNFAQDWAYLGDLTNSATGQKYVKGTDFDLDEYNVRFSVTPDYPAGTYCYFVTIDAGGNPTFPYVFGYNFYGNATGTNDTTISESVTTNFAGGSDFALTQSTPTLSNNIVTLLWQSTEGGTYTIESSTNSVNWNPERTNVAATAKGVSTTTNYISSVTNGTAYVRLRRTALATNDSPGGQSGVIAQTNVISFTLANSAPVVANAISDQSVTYGVSFSYTFATNVFTDVDTGQTLAYTANSSALTNTGLGFNTATRTFSATTIDATNGGYIATNYTISVVAIDNGSPAKSATNTFTFTINKAAASVTANNLTRAYGSTNPAFTGALSNFVAADAITASYSSPATTNTGAPSNWSITPTLADPGARLGNYIVTTNLGALTVTQASLVVTPDNFSRAYGAANPNFTGTLAGLQNGDHFIASYSAPATTNSPVGSYLIIAALDDVDLKLGNYLVTTNAGTLTVTNASGAANYSVTATATNSLVGLALAGTNQYTFTDSNSGLAITVALAMTPYSASNANAAFAALDFYGSVGRFVHLAVDGGLGGGDGNFVRDYEGADFTATLVSSSSGIATNTIRFGITGVGFRFDPTIVWNSSVRSNTVHASGETLYALDTGGAALADTNYSATLRHAPGSSDYQFSDLVDGTNYGLALMVSFTVGTNVTGAAATLASPSYTGGQFSFSVGGTTGASYIVEASTNLSSWTPLITNLAPFIYTGTNAAVYDRRFYRVVSP